MRASELNVDGDGEEEVGDREEEGEEEEDEYEEEEEEGEGEEDEGMVVGEEEEASDSLMRVHEDDGVESDEEEAPRVTPPHRFVPFEEDPVRQREVALSRSLVPASAVPLPAGFMSPPPLAVPRRRPSSLSFLPLPLPSRSSLSLPWSARLPLQRAKQKRRSEAMAKKKEIRGFVSEAAWRNWKKREEERHERWKRRDRKIVRGREKKREQGRGQDGEIAQWAEGRGEKEERVQRPRDRARVGKRS